MLNPKLNIQKPLQQHQLQDIKAQQHLQDTTATIRPQDTSVTTAELDISTAAAVAGCHIYNNKSCTGHWFHSSSYRIQQLSSSYRTPQLSINYRTPYPQQQPRLSQLHAGLTVTF
jgi:hypothetical protein